MENKFDSVLLDPEGKAGQAYGAKNTPHMFVINPEGKIDLQRRDRQQSHTESSRHPTSTNYVKVALDEAMAGKPVSNPDTEAYGCSVKYAR